MTQARHKIHFDAQGKGLYHPGHSECGQFMALRTIDPYEVTCKRCQKTEAFVRAIEEKDTEPQPRQPRQPCTACGSWALNLPGTKEAGLCDVCLLKKRVAGLEAVLRKAIEWDGYDDEGVPALWLGDAQSALSECN